MSHPIEGGDTMMLKAAQPRKLHSDAAQCASGSPSHCKSARNWNRLMSTPTPDVSASGDRRSLIIPCRCDEQPVHCRAPGVGAPPQAVAAWDSLPEELCALILSQVTLSSSSSSSSMLEWHRLLRQTYFSSCASSPPSLVFRQDLSMALKGPELFAFPHIARLEFQVQSVMWVTDLLLESIAQACPSLTSLRMLGHAGRYNSWTQAGLKAVFLGCTRLQELRFDLPCSTQCSGEIPAELGLLTRLTSLSLNLEMGAAALSPLPISVSSLTRLEELRLVVLGRHYFPHAFFLPCQSLRVLDLHCYKLKHLPHSLTTLQRLETLGLKSLQLSTLPALPNLSGTLTSLCVDAMMDTDVAAFFAPLTRLKQLTCMGRASLPHLPTAFAQSTCLTSLTIKYMPYVETLPESFGQLTNLQSLSIHRCSFLTHLPGSFTDLISLQELSLVHIRPTTLPEVMGALTRLTSLDLEHCCELTSLPDSLWSLPVLRRFKLMHVPQVPLPDRLGELLTLQCLIIGETRAEALPDSWSRLTALTSLSLDDALHLECLPASFTGLVMLERVTICGCPMMTCRQLVQERVPVGCTVELLAGDDVPVKRMCEREACVRGPRGGALGEGEGEEE